MTTLSDKIKELNSKGKSYKQIREELNCSLSTISYHLGVGQKLKSKKRNIKNYKNRHPFGKKIDRFIKQSIKNKKQTQLNWRKKLTNKISDFFYKGKNRMHEKITIEDIINKFSETPRCYLTNDPIDIYKPSTYHFDHMVPTSKGGDNSIDNLGICTKAANMAKSDLTVEEFIELCQKVVNYHKGGE